MKRARMRLRRRTLGRWADPRPGTTILATMLLLAQPASARTRGGHSFSADIALADGSRIVLIDSKTTAVQVLHKPQIREAASASMSHDGRHLVFTAFDPANRTQRLFLAEAPRFLPHRLNISGWAETPSWSPDDQRIVFALHPNPRPYAQDEDPAQLWEIDPRTGRSERLSKSPQCHQYPSFTADGRSILFTDSSCVVEWHVKKLDIATRQERLLTRGYVRDHEPVASPDGQRFAFARIRDGSAEIMVAEYRDTGHPRSLARAAHTMEPQLQWSRCGKRLFWVDQHVVYARDVDNLSGSAITIAAAEPHHDAGLPQHAVRCGPGPQEKRGANVHAQDK